MENDNAIFTRRSIRAYDNTKSVSKEQLKDILNAGMHAPSAMGKKPWEFLVATDESVINTISKIHPYCGFIKDAGSAIIVCANLDDSFTSSDGEYSAYDCSAATQNILLRAKQLGLGSCWCGIDPEIERINLFKDTFNLPENILPIALVVIGYPAEDPQLESPRYKESKVHWQKW